MGLNVVESPTWSTRALSCVLPAFLCSVVVGIPASAQVVRQITDSRLVEFFLPRVTADGSAA